ncbi:uncharacterized protein LOC110098654 [Dendrobium catenatum]|uniref:uncharacterized protein LOC110098654 n=1 Tax=Dendrobium catenatum TaxID=906689 RepID=UPI0010A02D0E|nr:uncharacterized protein LOC110098654 [Dendrobium catenatum]
MRIATNVDKVTHLLFADDVLVTAEARSNNVRRLKKIFKSYCSWTGQPINSQKSMVLYGRKVSKKRRRKLNKIMGYKEVKEFYYLGIKLAVRRMKVEDFSNTIEKAMCRLNSWGARCMVIAGRQNVIDQNSLLKHDFLPENGKQGLHYIAWETLCLPTSLGGFGIHGAAGRQGPLRARIAWMFLQNNNSLLYKILYKKFGKKIWDNDVKRGATTAWKIIKDGINYIRPIVRLQVNNGSSININTDKWKLDRCLSKWPATCNISEIAEKKVSFLMEEDGKWNLEILSEFFLADMIELIQQMKTGENNREDSLELIRTNTGKTIAALCEEANNLNNDGKYSKHNWLKKLKLNQRVYLFWLRALNGALPTNNWLCYRRLAVNSNCPRGCNENEDLEHVMIKCNKMVDLLQNLRECGFNVPSFQSVDNCIMNLRQNPDKGLTKIFALAVYYS